MHRLPFALILVFAVFAGACQRQPEERLRVVPQVGPVMPRRVAFSPVIDTRLLVMEATGIIGVWDIVTPSNPTLFSTIPARAIDATFSPDGRSVATACLDGRIRYWGTDGLLKWVSKGGHSGRARVVVITPTGIVSGGEDGAIRMWHLDGSPLGAPLADDHGAIVSLALSPRGDIVALAADDTLRLWTRSPDSDAPAVPAFEKKYLHQPAQPRDAAQFLTLAKHDMSWGWDHSLAFSPSGDAVAAVLFDSSVRVWGADGSARAVVKSPHGRPVRALAFSPRGDVIATAGFDGMVRRWRPDGSPDGVVAKVEGPIFSVGFSPSGDRFASAGADNSVRVWNRDGSLLATLPRHGEDAQIVGVALAPKSAVIAAADDGGGLWLWNLDATARGGRMNANKRREIPLAFSPTGDLLAAPGPGGTVGQWSSSGAPQGQPLHVSAQVSALAFSPTGDSLAIGTPQFQLWNDGRKLLERPIRDADYIQRIAFAPKGDFIVTGSWLGELQVWGKDGTPRATRPKQTGWEYVTGVAVAPGGDYLAATIGGDETQLLAFNLDLTPRGEPLAKHGEVVTGVVFSPTGQLVTGGADGVVRLWTLPARQMESFEVGLPINQLGYWNNLLWVRAADDPVFLQMAPPDGSTILFYDGRHELVATLLLRPGGALVFTPDGWFSDTNWPSQHLRAYRSSGEAVPEADLTRRRSPERVLAALRKAAG